jgi:EmrB/QacA subfamily drug resistance transporter
MGGAPEAAGAPAEVAGRRRWWIIGALLISMLLAALDQTIVATALPTIASELGGLAHLSWVVTSYLLASTASTPLWGKLGDLFGRKRIFQGSIVIFLAGSALAAASGDIFQLIVYRAIQGLGGGGLIVLAQAIVADVVPPRERGRYQGVFGGVFGLASVLGPLAGGFFVDQFSWHWVFLINLPLGAAALAATAVALPAALPRARPAIDYLGILLIAAAATALVLLTSLGGTTVPWLSWQVLGLAGLGIAIIVGFVYVERRVPEPVMPLRLFRGRTFVVASAIGFVTGFALFGALTYIPLYLQVVRGDDPTTSGLRLIPLMVGLLVTSVLGGMLVTRTGHYRALPIIGTAMATVALYLLSRLTETTSMLILSADVLLLGAGLGFVVQILVIAVQNSIEYRDLGAGTSAATFFRSIGASFGVAIIGSVFNSQLRDNLSRLLPAGPLPPGFNPTQVNGGSALASLPADIRDGYLRSYLESLQTVFFISVPVAAVAFILALLLPQVALKTTAAATDPGESLGMPTARSSAEELERALTVLARREDAARVYRWIAEEAETGVGPGGTWLLGWLGRNNGVATNRLPSSRLASADRVVGWAEELRHAGYVSVDGSLELTPTGWTMVDRIGNAREEGLQALLDGWNPELHPELLACLRELATELVGSSPSPKSAR